MATLSELVKSFESMMHSVTAGPNFLLLLIMFLAVYAIAYIVAAVPAVLLALGDISARYLHPRKDRWFYPESFDMVMNVLFAVFVAPVAVFVLAQMFHGHAIAGLILGLTMTAAMYHGVFLGRIIADYRRLPRLWDLVDEVIPM